jgi:hypothetical protein
MGRLFRGNVGASTLPVSDESNPYSDTAITWATGTTAEKEQKRFFVLDDGSKVWDLVGNSEEFVDWKVNQMGMQFVTPANKAYRGLEGFPGATLELSQIDVVSSEMPYESFLPYGSGYIKTSNYIGNYVPGNNLTGGFAIRGGRGGGSGLYYLNLTSTATTTQGYMSFRCVYRY